MKILLSLISIIFLSTTVNSADKYVLHVDTTNMILIPAGEFLMGSPETEGDTRKIIPDKKEHPQHKVYLNAYYIDKYEVTNEQFANFMNKYGKETDANGKKMILMGVDYNWEIGSKVERKKNKQWASMTGYEKYPVQAITWYGANQYAKYYGKRLPTEAEWEKACRAGSITKYCFGDNESILGFYAWYKDNSDGKSHPVGQKKPNAWGIYDMHGNVWEWCVDLYDGDYKTNSPNNTPQGANYNDYRAVRGGGDGNIFNDCRSAVRNAAPADMIYYNSFGFRCIANVVNKKADKALK